MRKLKKKKKYPKLNLTPVDEVEILMEINNVHLRRAGNDPNAVRIFLRNNDILAKERIRLLAMGGMA